MTIEKMLYLVPLGISILVLIKSFYQYRRTVKEIDEMINEIQEEYASVAEQYEKEIRSLKIQLEAGDEMLELREWMLAVILDGFKVKFRKGNKYCINFTANDMETYKGRELVIQETAPNKGYTIFTKEGETKDE